MADERTEKQKVQEITDKLEEGLKELFESEKYKTYLSTMSKFHNYSFNNTLLIAMQKPEATLVAGYKAWQKNFERHVNKGEKAIRILAPAPYKIKEERDKLDPVTGEMMFDENGMPQKEQVEVTIPAFRAVSVFDVSQTDGKPIPELEAQELLSTVEGYEDFVQALMNVAPVPIGFEDIPGDSKGYFHTEEKRIAVQENMSESQTLKTMVHEVAHSMLHNKEINRDDLIEEPAKDRNTKEVEAESVAYTVCQHFGIDTSGYSFGYIAGWSSGKDMKELKSSLDTIRKTASELITGIEGALRELQLNREMEQEQSKECILLIQNEDLTEFSLVNVRGMDTQELVAALTNMNEDDKLSIQAYLESKGAWTTELGNDKTREFEEYHLDVRYNLDTDEIIDVKAKIAEQIDNNLSVMEQAEIDALPDLMIGLSEMREYGYTWNEMLPLTQEKALEFFSTHSLELLREIKAQNIYYLTKMFDGSVVVTNPSYINGNRFEKVSEQIAISPENNVFTMGEDYILKITPIVTINGNEECEIENNTSKYTLSNLTEPAIGLKMERIQRTANLKYMRVLVSINDKDAIIQGSDWGEYSLHIYKYKDDIFPFHDTAKGRTITLVIQLDDEPGLLSMVLKTIAEFHANILTIHQSVPVNGIASLSLSIDVFPATGNVEDMRNSIESVQGIHYAKILARE